MTEVNRDELQPCNVRNEIYALHEFKGNKFLCETCCKTKQSTVHLVVKCKFCDSVAVYSCLGCLSFLCNEHKTLHLSNPNPQQTVTSNNKPTLEQASELETINCPGHTCEVCSKIEFHSYSCSRKRTIVYQCKECATRPTLNLDIPEFKREEHLDEIKKLNGHDLLTDEEVKKIKTECYEYIYYSIRDKDGNVFPDYFERISKVILFNEKQMQYYRIHSGVGAKIRADAQESERQRITANMSKEEIEDWKRSLIKNKNKTKTAREKEKESEIDEKIKQKQIYNKMLTDLSSQIKKQFPGIRAEALRKKLIRKAELLSIPINEHGEQI